MNWPVFGAALASGLISYPILTANLSMARKYALIFVQLITAVFLATITPQEHTVLAATAVSSGYISNVIAWLLGVGADKTIVYLEVQRVTHGRTKQANG